MNARNIITRTLRAAWQQLCRCARGVTLAFSTVAVMVTAMLVSCERTPDLHLLKVTPVRLTIARLAVEISTYWDYRLVYNVAYDWETDWYYGWDDEDRNIFGEQGYREPGVFNFRRYYTGNTPYAKHTNVIANTIEGREYAGYFEFGYWDMLVWNDIQTIDNVQSLNFDETASLDSVIAYTNESMRSSRYMAPRYTRSFYQPEPLFSAYEQAIEINENHDGFIYDEERDVWIKILSMKLRPITYIYLTQVIIHNNNNRVVSVDGTSDLSGMARTMNVNNGKGGSDAITTHYSVRLKRDCDMNGEKVDIVGGRLMTFGICDLQANDVQTAADVKDSYRHYMDVTMQFNNGMDSTLVFDVTDQVRHFFRGGVITVELDMDTIPIPRRSGGSAFNAVVEEFKEETHEIEM